MEKLRSTISIVHWNRTDYIHRFFYTQSVVESELEPCGISCVLMQIGTQIAVIWKTAVVCGTITSHKCTLVEDENRYVSQIFFSTIPEVSCAAQPPNMYISNQKNSCICTYINTTMCPPCTPMCLFFQKFLLSRLLQIF